MTEPSNSSDDVVRPEVGRAALWSFLSPIIMLAVVAGFLWLYWRGQPPHVRSAEETGNPSAVVGTSGNTTPGGIDTEPDYRRTVDELAYRGVTSSRDAREKFELRSSK